MSNVLKELCNGAQELGISIEDIDSEIACLEIEMDEILKTT